MANTNSEGYNKYLFTLLAQCRELSSQCIKDQLTSAEGSLEQHATSAPLFLFGSPSRLTIESERQELQKELTAFIEQAFLPMKSDNLRQMIHLACNPLSGKGFMYTISSR